MTAHDDLDRTLSSWFAVESQQAARAGDLERVLATTRAIRPRPGWLAGPGSHWIHGSATSRRRRALVLAVTVLALILAAVAVVVGARLVTPPPDVPAKGLLAYPLDGDIYVADWDGSNPIAIATASVPKGRPCGFWAEGPMWSPDGRHLAYRGSPDCGESFAVIAEPNGHVLARIPGQGWRISWSPDSTRVALWITNGQTIGIYGLDGGRQAMVEVPAGYGPPGDFDPLWSADGGSMLVALAEIAVSGGSRVWALPVDGGTATPFATDDPRSYRGAATSRDGRRIAYVPFDTSLSLVMANADGSVLRVLPGAQTDGAGGFQAGASYGEPIWSPTADRVAYTWTADLPLTAAEAETMTFELRVVDVASGAVTTLATAHGISPMGFSLDGQRVLFRQTAADSTTSIWSVTADGSSGAELLVAGAWADWQWSQ